MRGQHLKTVDQASRKRVARTYAVHDMSDLIGTAYAESLAVIEAGGPTVVRRALGLPQGDGDGLQVRILGQNLRGELLICLLYTSDAADD